MKVRLSIVILSFLSQFSVASAEQGNRILLASTNFGKASVSIGGARVIKAEEILKLAVIDEEMVILDVRNSELHTKGNIAWSETFSPDPASLKYMGKKIADRQTSIIVYGNRNSSTAAKSAKKLAAYGYKNVYWFKGGFPEWKEKSLKIDL